MEETIVCLGIASLNILLLWLAMYLSGKSLCFDNTCGPDSRIMFGINGTLWLGIAGTAPIIKPGVEQAILTNLIFLIMAVWCLISVIAVNGVAKSKRWQETTIREAFILSSASVPALLLMGIAVYAIHAS